MIGVLLPWLALAAVLAELVSRGFVTRHVVAAFAVLVMKLDLLAQGLVRVVAPPSHTLLGSCQKCGACCRSLVGDPPAMVKNTPLLLKAFIAYHRATHRFEAYGRGPNGEVIFRCGHLQPDNTCGIYWRRPLVCRTYPVVPSQGAPSLLPDCSYRIAARSVATMRARPGLHIVNPKVAVHHPTPDHAGESQQEDYELVALDEAATDVAT
jgi:Fe-S-cluster containining protein